MRPGVTTLGLLAAACIALLPQAAAADCRQVAGEVRAAIAATAVGRYDALREAMAADPACDARFRAQAGRTMARSLLTTLPVDSPPAAIAAALRFGRPWQVLVALGDAYYDRQDWTGAGNAYQEALADMADAAANPTPAPEKTVRQVQRRATQSGALMPEDDLFASRGIAAAMAAEGPAAIAFFASGSADLAEADKARVRAALAAIEKTAPHSLVVIGHADPTEDAALAGQRAGAVAAYLDELGYAGRIATASRGAGQPFAADGPERLTPEQKLRLDRRVEYAPGD